MFNRIRNILRRISMCLTSTDQPRPPQPLPLSTEIKQKVPQSKYIFPALGYVDSKEYSDIICNICLGETGDFFEIPCKHKFHKDCLLKWNDKLKSNTKRFTCPMCRQ